MGRWRVAVSIPIFILYIAIFTHSVFECSPRCTGLVQLSSARPSLPGLVLAQVYRSRPVVQGSHRCTVFTHYNGVRTRGVRRLFDGYQTGATFRTSGAYHIGRWATRPYTASSLGTEAQAKGNIVVIIVAIIVADGL